MSTHAATNGYTLLYISPLPATHEEKASTMKFVRKHDTEEGVRPMVSGWRETECALESGLLNHQRPSIATAKTIDCDVKDGILRRDSKRDTKKRDTCHGLSGSVTRKRGLSVWSA